MIDTPDPYVQLRVPASVSGRKRTAYKNNDVNPVWNESFKFTLDQNKKNKLEITLIDKNIAFGDEILGVEGYDLDTLPLNEHRNIEIKFTNTSTVHLKLRKTKEEHKGLRSSLALCDEEKMFQYARREKIFHNMQYILGEDAPSNISEVPHIAVLGSGGGFRAMVGLSGVFKALSDTKILDMVEYCAGLSGSSWYISQLYSHKDWPNIKPGKQNLELRQRIESSWTKLLITPKTMYKYISSIISKRRQGQPVSFTDFFGHLIGETLIGDRMDCKLSDMAAKVIDGQAPMPLMTCLHVKKHVSAMVFHEWVEFSPFEIGMPKYGVFMKPHHFGSKFYMGRLLKEHNEPPLHFLQGIWGSAFTILFKRLLTTSDATKKDPIQLMRMDSQDERMDMDTAITNDATVDTDDEESSDASDSDTESELDDDDDVEDLLVNNDGVNSERKNEFFIEMENIEEATNDALHSDETSSDRDDNPNDNVKSNENIPSSAKDETISSPTSATSQSTNPAEIYKRTSRRMSLMGKVKPVPQGPTVKKLRKQQSSSQKKYKSRSMWQTMLMSMFEKSELLSTRAGRAGLIHNFMRGLQVEKVYPFSPFSPTTPSDQTDFKSIFEEYATDMKRLYMVDGGLTFNSPYPLVLRPQRKVNLILSFDFSARDSDDAQPFKELLLAEKWAKINRVPFPKIDVSNYVDEPPRECYVFRNDDIPYCPVVMHFCLVNNEFKFYKKPGVRRETKEETDFADFSLFDDPEAPYSTFNFTYSNKSFDRLTQLTEFNTRLCVDRIREEILKCIENKKSGQRAQMSMKDIPRLRRMMSKDNASLLESYIKEDEESNTSSQVD
ncbi:unnamed protein product [Owenia fusiformis]|uniref:Phospholipase A2 n=1 Tax=Owenia fusiformis TaxID=6347 RepID=A0A8J1TYS1_OWEFU|nr:unnamed protein product [Owenia fusiformis]